VFSQGFYLFVKVPFQMLKMNKTILIGTNNGISSKVNRWLFPLFGGVWLVMGTRLIYKYNASTDTVEGLIIGSLMLLLGVYYVLYGLTAFSYRSKLALKIIVNNEWVEIKNKFLKLPIKMMWADIRSIEFGQYKIRLQTEDSNKEFRINSDANVSIEVKEAIRKVANEKGIEIVGG